MALAHSLFSLLLQFVLLPLCIIAQQTSPIKVGSTLTTNNFTWLSPSGEFALGFRQVNNASYLLSIWYSKIPDTIVWYAGPDGVLAPEGSVLTCTADQGGLVINDPQGQNLYNLSHFVGNISCCFLNDTGNLLTKGAKGDTIWQSFDHPTDTLLPSQRGKPIVYSRHSKSNFTRGKFQLWMRDSGDLALYTWNLVTGSVYDDAYYSSSTNDPNNSSNSGYMVNYGVSGHMYILRKNGEQVDLLQGATFPQPTEDYYFRATLNYDGVLVWYYHKKDGSSTWSVLTWVPDDICSSKRGTMDSGVCGYNSICKMNTKGEYPTPTCECPPMYSSVDPSDAFGSCKPDFKMPISNEEVGYRLERLPSVDWPLLDYAMFNPFTEEECKKSCLDDFKCVAAIMYGQTQTCWLKDHPLINGRIDETRTALLKVSDGGNKSQPFLPPIQSRRHRTARVRMNPLASTLMGISVLINLLLFGAILGIWLLFRRRQRKVPRTATNTLVTWNNMISCFAYKDLEKATEGFKEELGRGACAIVYKGVIEGSQTLVAVKKIDRALLREADKEFRTEVSVIGKTHHKNLVRLIGFCHDEDHRMLVYELMRNGSLADFLFGETRPSWLVRVRIAQGVARGLLYLHEECENPIIHCDIKPQNILLDDNFEARISDFGLSKLLMLNQFQTHTAIRGTKGYVAPEWFRNKPVTVKVDVYSFGVVLLELISCRRCIYSLEPGDEERVILIEWAFDCYQSGDLTSLVDNDIEALGDKIRMEKLLKVAIWCIQEDPDLRPTMRQVTLMLEGVIEACAPPTLDHYSPSVSVVSDY